MTVLYSRIHMETVGIKGFS